MGATIDKIVDGGQNKQNEKKNIFGGEGDIFFFILK